jgi:hypothetical protein
VNRVALKMEVMCRVIHQCNRMLKYNIIHNFTFDLSELIYQKINNSGFQELCKHSDHTNHHYYNILLNITEFR